MATPYKRANIARQKIGGNQTRATYTNGGGAVDNFYPLDPSMMTSIIVTHHASDTPLVSLTNTLDSNDDLEHANVLFGQVYAGDSTPYIATQTSGFTGIEIAVTPTNGDVEVSISQFRNT